MAYIGISPQNGVRKKHTYTASGSQTDFTGAGAEGITLSYKDSNFVDVSDPEERLKEYSASVLCNAQKCNMPIFFTENSGYDLHRDADFSKRLKEIGIVLMIFSLSTEYEKAIGDQAFERLEWW